ncbi:uncharacterized protein CIMG_05885 [Coccidioides immitis RS]|uniref:Roadblock/LAMTOR2 domain-containing protein n=4 Tax=Coccidioides immitis TaxID=5501 RepID=J3K6Z8_COCIM|nr:uncharacterized protein CIMG_05885 [Coccidioides immitis RS]KMP02948.1 hypothetical protein CIRG_02640 [Coccidioides immitis RMSCC 2394]KMU77391.1 hypothetical protein CISG_06638 [Coccidioides immitis RMSCC 3703]KMU90736.1 hypothetical protein CIHG_08696 [Coccidioides immitis H538.4]TPX23372.1 hypothetical protein DIZ76_012702 [Coccidioides immitis]EAS30406.3 hypothetical protein CIMG_05885 [Coccidioides immitis RS]
MTETIPASQIPQHVAAQLAHLTSRPSVQSTLILSRKDGSIIQVTGKLAPQSSPITSLNPTPGPEVLSSTEETPTAPSIDGEATAVSSTSIPNAPYKPSEAETLASHIYAFVSSASALSAVLSGPSAKANNNEPDYGAQGLQGNGMDMETDTGRRENQDKEAGNDREDEDEVKLLRLRTKIHEVIIIPDRRYLLCVVQDVSVSGVSGGGGSHR